MHSQNMLICCSPVDNSIFVDISVCQRERLTEKRAFRVKKREKV